MYLGFQNKKIKFYSAQPLDVILYNLDKVEETEEEYVVYGDEYRLKSTVMDVLLAKAKEDKIKEAIIKAEEAVKIGYINYRNAQIETNTQTVSDLNSTRELCIITGQTSYNWLSKDDVPLVLAIDNVNPMENDDFVKIGLAISEFKNNIWTSKYIQYINAIENATTIEEVDAIEIDYSKE